MSISLVNLSASQLKRALAVREKIDALEAEFNSIMENNGTVASVAGKGKRKMSSEAREKIAAAQRARWARAAGKAVKVSLDTAAPKTGKRKMSAAAKAKIAAAARKRWAKAKAEGKSSLASK